MTGLFSLVERPGHSHVTALLNQHCGYVAMASGVCRASDSAGNRWGRRTPTTFLTKVRSKYEVSAARKGMVSKLFSWCSEHWVSDVLG